jgi:hypothetical protein
MSGSKRSFSKKWRRFPEKLNLRKLRIKIPEAQDVLNAQGLAIYGLTVGTSTGKGKILLAPCRTRYKANSAQK